MKVFASADGDTIRGYAYFTGGGRAVGCKVKVLRNETLLSELTTNAKGEFSYVAEVKDDLTFRVETGDGHFAEYTVQRGEITIPDRKEEAMTEKEPVADRDLEALHTQVRLLREQIESYENRTRIHDIVGGIGYVLGFFGLILFLKSRSKKAES